jgi:hypothetical protein
MRERPILFNGAMVRAILSGAKSQTRRPVKPAPDARADWMRSDINNVWHAGTTAGEVPSFGIWQCPFGQPGDRLWVRETWADLTATHGRHWEKRNSVTGLYERGIHPFLWYAADGDQPEMGCGEINREPWRPSTSMPRSACRLVLEITDVRVERLQAISEADAQAEGARHFPQLPMGMASGDPCRWSMEEPQNTDECLSTARFAFANYFCKTYGKAPKGLHDQRPWDANPWVWVIGFRRLP